MQSAWNPLPGAEREGIQSESFTDTFLVGATNCTVRG